MHYVDNSESELIFRRTAPSLAEPMPGVYIIRCRENLATYCGASKSLRKRLGEHRCLLNRGHHQITLLQRDWKKFGEQSFESFLMYAEESRLSTLERRVILSLKCLEHQGGYNAAVNGRWALSARIRNIETKLRRRYKLLPGVGFYSRLSDVCIEIYCKNDIPLIIESNWMYECTPQTIKFM